MSGKLPIRDLKARFLARSFIIYLNFVIRTSKIEFINSEEFTLDELRNCILGFWHKDSSIMNLILDYVAKRKENIKGIVTADRRGDFIENILYYYGARTLRMPDGMKLRGFFKDLINESKVDKTTIAIALDGPLGPLHEPKKIGFMLSNESNKPLIGVKINVTRKISLTKRWDNYRVPLPFTTIMFSMHNLGVSTREDLKNFKETQEKAKKILL